MVDEYLANADAESVQFNPPPPFCDLLHMKKGEPKRSRIMLITTMSDEKLDKKERSP